MLAKLRSLQQKSDHLDKMRIVQNVSRKLLLILQDFCHKVAVDPLAGTNQKENSKNETTYGFFKIMNVFMMFRLGIFW